MPNAPGGKESSPLGENNDLEKQTLGTNLVRQIFKKRQDIFFVT